MEVHMEIFTSFLGLMDSTIIAMMQIPILALFLIGSLMLAVIGLFILIRDAAKGRSLR